MNTLGIARSATRVGLPVFALAGAATMLATAPETTGFTLNGNSQGIFQRDFRVNNSFTNAGANNNQVPHDNFPGALGATMAIWKGAIEWNSQAHGDGQGDPHQPGGLGSGGANFDCHFQGETNQVPAVSSNIVGTIGGSNNGVLAFTEWQGLNVGWRIFFFRTLTVPFPGFWSDGPGSIGGNEFDIQGIMAHEYGHALGLGHTFNGPTMQPGGGPGEIQMRSIHADDIAGIQAIYGAANFNTKPQIHDTTLAGTTLTITGENFSPSGNSVWFTKANNTDGNFLAVGGLTSNGTSLVVQVPANAAPGNILVRKSGNSGSSLSETHPFDPSVQDCLAVNYCFSSTNSTGTDPLMSSSGTPSLSLNNFQINAFGLPPGQPGLFYYGPTQILSFFGNGWRCVGGTTKRLGIVNVDAFGFAWKAVDVNNLPQNDVFSVSEVVNFQLWYRDPAAGGAGFNLTDGLSVTWCP